MLFEFGEVSKKNFIARGSAFHQAAPSGVSTTSLRNLKRLNEIGISCKRSSVKRESKPKAIEATAPDHASCDSLLSAATESPCEWTALMPRFAQALAVHQNIRAAIRLRRKFGRTFMKCVNAIFELFAATRTLMRKGCSKSQVLSTVTSSTPPTLEHATSDFAGAPVNEMSSLLKKSSSRGGV